MTDDNEDFENYTINYQQIVNSREQLAVTRMLAQHLINNPYYTIGEFLKNLSDGDLQTLQDVAESAMQADEEVTDDRLGDVILISQMLAEAEGCAFGMDMDSVMVRSNQMATFITLESLYRKGLIKLHRENLSFGDDAGHKIVAERIDNEPN